MPWDRTRPANAKYRTTEHTGTRAQLMAQLRLDGYGWCAEPVCVMPSRLLTPDMGRDIHLCHNDAGDMILGLGHSQCNLSAAGRKGHRLSKQARHGTPRSQSTIW